ncbi:alpha-galactosidase [bacterium]|nr:MAG: alpha-galactosidase [bacterium]
MLLLNVIPTDAHAVQVKREAGNLRITAPALRVECNLATGNCNYAWNAGPSIRTASCSARLKDGRELSATDYTIHQSEPRDIVPINDAFGKGRQITVHHRKPGFPELRQQFRIYDNKPFCSVRLEVVDKVPIASNYLAPLVCDSTRTTEAGAFLDTGDKPRTLFVPFDNDMFVRYNSDYSSNSHEVTAIYDNSSRHGFVLGSLSHDIWKTGIEMGEHSAKRVGQLRVFGGMGGQGTHDIEPHGFVSGTTISSPLMFVGYFSDWRDGLETYGAANAALTPPLPWQGGVPFGWNSWAAYGKEVSYERFLAASDFFKTQLQPKGFDNKGTLYINVDSFWDNMTTAQLIEAARHIHANGQKAGIYWTPFTYWGDNFNQKVEGTNARYTFGDIALKDASGKPLPKLDGGYPLDPSHPGTLARIDWQMKRFVDWGYDFVKLDFINAGALEGVHYDPQLTTGIAAYNVGMKRIVDALNPQKIGRPFFISLSIAPLFPSHYAHGRRGSCDAFGSLNDSEYMLNSLTYGWWVNRTLYRFNDPDHIVLSASEAEARTRFNSAVIAGTMLLDSDDLTKPENQQRALKILTNSDVNALAKQGHAFRPVEVDTGSHSTNIFVAREGRDYWVAAFNFDGKQSKQIKLDLARIGLKPNSTYHAQDLWGHSAESVKQSWDISLAPAESRIWRLTKR